MYVFRVNVRSRESIGRSEKRTYVYLVGVRSRIKTYFCGWNLRSKGIKRIRCVKVQISSCNITVFMLIERERKLKK